MAEAKLTTPLTDKDVESLNIGDKVLITGSILVGRDSAHKRLIDLLDAGKPLPVDLKGQLIYYAGPSPARPGNPVGSAGPTTSGRMDPYAPRLLALGLKGMIGKGSRSAEVIEACKKHKAVYLAAVGGAAALIAKSVKNAEVVAYPELGPEALRLMEVEDFPAVVINDTRGNDLYVEGRAKYQK